MLLRIIVAIQLNTEIQAMSNHHSEFIRFMVATITRLGILSEHPE